MSLSRVKFSDSVDGSSPYTIPINPSKIELNASELYVVQNTIDGGNVKQSAYFDSRPHSLQWAHIPLDYSGFASMLATLNEFIDQIKYVNFQDIEYRIAGTTWQKVQVIDLRIQLASGGRLKQDVELILSPRQ